MRISIIILSVSILFSCKNNTPATSSKEENKNASTMASTTDSASKEKATPPVEGKNDSLNYRLVVMFYSTGEGVESAYIQAFEQFVGDYSARTGKEIESEKRPWGREGETDFCLKLNELTPSEQADFVTSAKEQLKNAKWVNIKENYPCKHRGR